MSKILGSLKSIFSSKKAPKYKIYSSEQLKLIAMKSRIILDELYQKNISKIEKIDSQLIQVVENTTKYLNQNAIQNHYELLQQIGKKVVEVESIKIFIQILKKIQSNSNYLINTNGDIAKMKQQVRWFQCILWYRKSHQIKNLEDIYEFCFNFFKGMDITMQINVKCQIFQIYPILKYLSGDIILPLQILMIQIIHYITPKISDQIMQQVYKINHHELKKWINLQKNQAKKRSDSRSPRKISYSPSPRKQNKQKMSKSNVYQLNFKQTSIKKSNQQELNSKIKNPFQSFGNTTNSIQQKQYQNTLKQQKQDVSVQKQIKSQEHAQKQNQFIQKDKQYKSDQISPKKISLSRLFSNNSFSMKSESQINQNKQTNQNDQLKQQTEIQSLGTTKISLSRLFSGGNSKVLNKNDCNINIPQQQNSLQKEQSQLQYNKILEKNQQIQNQLINHIKQQNQILINQNSQLTITEEESDDFKNKKQTNNQQDQQPQQKVSQQNQQKQKNHQKQDHQKYDNQKQNHQKLGEDYFDEEQSLQFIKQSISIQKKAIKKAYMVSIYARQQYVNIKK